MRKRYLTPFPLHIILQGVAKLLNHYGDSRWGTAVLEAQLAYGEKSVEKFFKKIGIAIYDKTNLSEILPVEIFGHTPLGEEWYE